ncbi:MAG: DNA-3-methyladenine glycosylase 2 family protein [Acidobacteriota bacterium]|nr:DNA-3-methyladenine glycosylase 2 family protein [Acidobacteriota bacterium]
MSRSPLTSIAPTVVLDEAGVARAARQLAKRDPDLALILKNFGSPPLWARRAGFSTLVQIILEQQVSLASAASIFARLSKSIVPLKPVRMIELGEGHLKSMGLTRQKTAYCLDLAASLHDKRLDLSRLAHMNDADAKAALMEVKGLGSWSADVYLLMALRRPDIWPAHDLALAIAITKLKQLKARPTPNELLEMAEAWKPFRSVAARMLWQYYLAQRKR